MDKQEFIALGIAIPKQNPYFLWGLTGKHYCAGLKSRELCNKDKAGGCSICYRYIQEALTLNPNKPLNNPVGLIIWRLRNAVGQFVDDQDLIDFEIDDGDDPFSTLLDTLK